MDPDPRASILSMDSGLMEIFTAIAILPFIAALAIGAREAENNDR